MNRPVRVLLVVDSMAARDALTHALSQQSDIEVVASARDEAEATRLLRLTIPDLIVLDVDTPRMDAISFLRKLMMQHPLPTVICSSLADAAPATAIAALEAGAIDMVRKPTRASQAFFDAESMGIAEVIRAAAHARVRVRPASSARSPSSGPLPSRSASPVARTAGPKRPQTMKVVAVGASTGGTEAIRVFLQGFDSHAPPMVIVQHMPHGLGQGFARYLARVTRLFVKEAASGDPLLAGRVLIAPGHGHVVVKRGARGHLVEVADGPAVNGHCPSVDVLFDSVAAHVGSEAIGILMTGRGDDGARGLLRMREAGAETFVQDEESCVVYGMPREAVRMGAAVAELPLERLSAAVMEVLAQQEMALPGREPRG